MSTPGSDPSTSFTGATPASRSRLRVDDWEKPTNGTSGPRWLDSFAFFDLDSSCWRTSQGTLLSASEPSPPIWPRWGMTSAGDAFALPRPAHRTAETDSSLLPSPQAMESTPTDEYVERMRDGNIQADQRLYLDGAKWHAQRTLSRIAPTLLPTPMSHDRHGAKTREKLDELAATRAKGAPRNLNEVAKHELLPTPGAWLGRRPENSISDPERAASRQHTEGRRGDRSFELPDALALLPTPAARDGKGPMSRTSARSDNGRPRTLAEAGLPSISELLPEGSPTGVYTPRRSPGGRQSPESPHPDQLTIEDALPPSSSSG